jgi:hypothetical protein
MSENLFCAGQRYSTTDFLVNWERTFNRHWVCLNTVPSKSVECRKVNGYYQSIDDGTIIDKELIMSVLDYNGAVERGIIK